MSVIMSVESNKNKLKIYKIFITGPSPRPVVAKSPANSAGSDIRFKPYDLNKTTSVVSNKPRSANVKIASSTQRNSPSNAPAENGNVTVGQNYRCYICERLYPRNQMEW